MKTNSLIAASLFAASSFFSTSLFAASTWSATWDSPSCTTSTTEVVGNSYTCSEVGATTMTATAWSTTAGSPATQFAAATLKRYSGGFGVQANGSISDSGSPEHSMDNHIYTDAILLKFDVAVALTSINLGWTYRDRDISVLAYKESTASTPSISGLTAAGLIANSWQLIGNYSSALDGTTSNSSDAIATITNQGLESSKRVSSSWWLVSAYNAAFTTSAYDRAEHGGSPLRANRESQTSLSSLSSGSTTST